MTDSSGSDNRADVRTVVIDAGGRYGLHPTWKSFRAELQYVLFEPDAAEGARLRDKYAARADEIAVEDRALAERDGSLTIHFFRNRAMSSSAVRTAASALFRGERSAEVDVTESVTVPATSIDSYCDARGIRADFLKIDTEGTELEILRGAEKHLESSVLGVRSEVNFERTFVGKDLFGAIHDFLLDREFFLLNLDYEGRGEYQNDFVRMDGRFGILANCDAVWLKRKERLFAKDVSAGSLESKILKYAAFCFHNYAADVAIDVLLEGRAGFGADYRALEGTRLFSHVDVLLQRHLYTLKWVPGQSLARNEETYQAIFGRQMKTMNAFMQSLELNPD